MILPGFMSAPLGFSPCVARVDAPRLISDLHSGFFVVSRPSHRDSVLCITSTHELNNTPTCLTTDSALGVRHHGLEQPQRHGGEPDIVRCQGQRAQGPEW